MRRVLLVLAALAALAIIGVGIFAALYYTATPNPKWYASAEQLDPIFAIAGTDPAQLRSAINSLFTQQREIAGHFAGSDPGEIEKSLYPTEFLQLLPTLEETRQTLLADPSLHNATVYHTMLLETIRAYQHGAENLATVLLNTSNPSFSVGFLEGTTTNGYIASQLRTAAAAVTAQQDKEQARYTCMQHYVPLFCQSTGALATIRMAKLKAPLSILPAPTSSVKAADSLVRQIIQYSYPHLVNLSPLIAITSRCVRYPTVYARAWQFTTADGGTAFKTYIANDAFFYDVALLEQGKSAHALYHAALTQGAVYEYQNIANYYICLDSGLYLADISRVVGVRELAQQASSTAAAQLLSLPTLQLSDVAQYAQRAGSDDAAERYLEGSAHFDQTINTLVNDNVYVLTLLKNGSTMESSYLLLSRSYASVLFMFGNPTFVPKPISFFSYIGRALPDPTLVSWNNTLSKKESASEILTQAKKSVDIFRVLDGR